MDFANCRLSIKPLLSIAVTFILLQANAQVKELPAPTTYDGSRCGAGILVLKAQSKLDGTPGLNYNWYLVGSDTLEFLGSIESGFFVTPQHILSTTYAVSISLNGQESEKRTIQAVVENTASILESPAISLCDSVILHASTTFSEAQLDSASFQWQHYEAKRTGDAQFRDLEDSLSRAGLTYVTKEPGFYRIVVTLPDGCKAISKEVEVTEKNLLEPTILGVSEVCFLQGNEEITLENKTGRSFTEYQWEESLNGSDFYAIGEDSEEIELLNPTLDSEDSSRRYYRLILTEQTCSKISSIDTVRWYRKPEGEIHRLGSKADFFYCETDPELMRTMVASKEPHCIMEWYRLQELPISGLKNISDLNPFDPIYDGIQYFEEIRGKFQAVFTGDSVILNQEDWGVYVGLLMDTVTGCTSYTNTIFAETTVPDFEPQYICRGDTVTLFPEDLSSETYQWSYKANEGDTYTVISTDTTISLYPPETTGGGWYELTVTKNGCTETFDTLLLESTMPPAPALTPHNASVCPGGSILLSSSIPDSSAYVFEWYTLELMNDLFEEVSLSSEPEYIATSPDTYYFSVYRDFCGYDVSITVNDDSPNTDLNVKDSIVCGPIMLALEHPNDTYTYQWYFSEDSVNFVPLADETLSSHLALETGYYYVNVAEDEACQAISPVVEIGGVISAQLVSFEDTIRACDGSTKIILRTADNDGSEFRWYYHTEETGDYQLATGTNNSNIYEASQEGYYKVRIADGGCSAESVPIYVELSEGTDSILAEIVGDYQVCLGSPAYFSVQYETSSSEYLWEYSLDQASYVPLPNAKSDSITIDSGPFAPLVSEDSLSVFLRLQVNDMQCAALSEPHEFVIYKEPDISIRNTRTSNAENVFYCDSTEDSVSLIAFQNTTNLALNYHWELLDASGFFIGIDSADEKLFTPTIPGTYRCRAYIPGLACYATSNEIQIDALPSAIFVSSPEYCRGDTLELMADPRYQSTLTAAVYKYQWFYSHDDGVFDSIPDGDSYYLSITPESIAYGSSAVFFKVSNSGCSINSDTLYLSEEAAPVITIETEPATCTNASNGTAQITGTGAGYSYILNDGMEQSSPSFENLTPGVYNLTVVSPNGCKTDTSFTMADQQTMREVIPEFDIVLEHATCPGAYDGSANLIGLEEGFSFILDQEPHIGSFFSDLAARTYHLLIQDSLGCEKDTLFEINNTKQLELSIAADTSQLKGIAFNILGSGAEEYQWYPEEFFTSPQRAQSLVLVPEDYPADTVIITAEGSTSEGCVALQQVTIHLTELDEPRLSKFFSPNGDGQNDFLEIKGLKPGESSKLKVFDNWGKEIFTIDNYRNASSDSEALNRSLKKEGVYFYLFTTPDKILKGSFYVRR